ncbi:phytoene/squalene synthase family protein [Phreatobacter sp.]|uniref:phytoene/squalene synthase family protein n=1 Tax=Phreatobacter sp. TaxID=1966341 RepID=UPI003F70C9A3
MPMPRRPDPGDLAACRDLLRVGSKSFFAASVLLPAAVRDPATVLYAFCRVADDAVDLSDDAAAAVLRLGARLDAIYAGLPADDPVDRALAVVVQSHALPRALFDALIDGLAWDAEGRSYATLSDLIAYSARVAGTVGALMTLLMGCRDPHALARACDLGVAMQLTNIARDVGEDARAGRLYLPLDWLAEAGLPAGSLGSEVAFDPRVAVVVRRLLAEADRLYRRSEGGITALPLACRPAIHAARLIYAEIAVLLAARGFDSITHRAVVPRHRKVALLARALVDTGFGTRSGRERALAEVQFLIDAVETQDAIVAGLPGFARLADINAGLERVLDMVDRLGRNPVEPRQGRATRARRSVRTGRLARA